MGVRIPFPPPDYWYSVRDEHVLDGPRMDGGIHTRFYPTAVPALVDGEINWATDDIRVMLCNRDYYPLAWHTHRGDVTGEVTGTGYRSGGNVLTGRTATIGADGTFMLDADDVTWPSATFTAASAVVYFHGLSLSSSLLICSVDFGCPIVVTCGTFTLTWLGAVGSVTRPGPLVAEMPS